MKKGFARAVLVALLSSAINSLWISQYCPELRAETKDPVLEEQISRLAEALKSVYQQIAQHREATRTETDEAKKATLDAELRNLRKQRDDLENLLHELSEQAQITSPTKVDELVKRIRSFERYQEELDRREETLRDRRKSS